MNIEIEGQVTEHDHSAAQWLHIKPRLPFSIIGILLIVLAVLVTWRTLGQGNKYGTDESDWILIGVGIYMIIYFAILMPRKWKKRYRQNQGLHESFKLNITDDGINAVTERGYGVKPWSHYHRWKEGNGVFVLYLTDGLFQIIPKHLFHTEHQIDEFRTKLRNVIK